jgi:hypothetical protein
MGAGMILIVLVAVFAFDFQVGVCLITALGLLTSLYLFLQKLAAFSGTDAWR